MSVAIIIAAFILILFVVASVHELGHFITAKRAGVHVEEFGLGFPPRIVGIKRGETTYSLNAIPAGAFVKSIGENDPTVPRSLASVGTWQRLWIYAAGPLINIALAFILLSAFFSLPTDVLRGDGIMVYSVVKDSPADIAGIEPGNILLSIDGETIHNSTEVQNAVNLCEDENGCEISITIQKDDEISQLKITPSFNPDYDRHTIGVFLCWNIVNAVESGSSADMAGIMVGDSLLSVNSQPIYSIENISEILNTAESTGELELILLRQQEVVLVTLPAVTAANQNTAYTDDALSRSNLLGADFYWVNDVRIEQEQVSVAEAVHQGAEFIVRVPEMIIAAIPSISEDPNKAALVGPIGAGQLTVEIVKSAGFDYILFMAGLISLGIGLFNFIPIPPLDGGGMLVALIESIRRGKRLTQRAMRIAYTSGTVLLIALMVLITYNDILRLINGGGFGL